MAATVVFSESNGAGETVTSNISNVSYGSVDQPNIVAANHPVIIGTNAFSKMVRMQVTAMGGSTSLSNFKLWKSAGVYLAGEQLNSNTTAFPSEGTYAQPSQALLNYGAIQTSLPGSTNLYIGGGAGGSIIAPGFTDYWRSQTVSSLLTPEANGNQKTISVQWDEV